MRYQSLGRSGLQVSAVALGSWLTYGAAVDKDGAKACIRRAYDLGVNFFDTANEYASGEAERAVGRALAGIPRSSYVLGTKVFYPMGRHATERGLSRKHVFEQLHASLRRLDTEYIDLYQCHRFDARTPVGETCAVMHDLIRAGKVLYWGVSEWAPEQIAEAVLVCRRHGWDPPISNQPQYSLLYRRIETGSLPVARALGLGTVVWSPLAMGVLTGKYRSADELPAGSRAATDDGAFMRPYLAPAVLDRVAQARAVVEQAGCSLTQAALAWCLRREGLAAVIVGASRPDHVDHAVAAVHLLIDDDVLEQVEDILAPAAREVVAAWPPRRRAVDTDREASAPARHEEGVAV
jgi:voltage-dependent potassium channel beta subunit